MGDIQALPVPAQEKTAEPLKHVNLYIASSVTGPGLREGSCGWVLECPDRPPSAKNPMAGTLYLGETTAHGALLRALREAMGHVRSRCALTVYTDSPYMAQALSVWLPEWERNGYMTKKGKPVADREDWQEAAILLNAAGFPAEIRLKEAHAWRNWLAWEVKKSAAEGGKRAERLNAARQQAGKEGQDDTEIHDGEKRENLW